MHSLDPDPVSRYCGSPYFLQNSDPEPIRDLDGEPDSTVIMIEVWVKIFFFISSSNVEKDPEN